MRHIQNIWNHCCHPLLEGELSPGVCTECTWTKYNSEKNRKKLIPSHLDKRKMHHQLVVTKSSTIEILWREGGEMEQNKLMEKSKRRGSHDDKHNTSCTITMSEGKRLSHTRPKTPIKRKANCPSPTRSGNYAKNIWKIRHSGASELATHTCQDHGEIAPSANCRDSPFQGCALPTSLGKNMV